MKRRTIPAVLAVGALALAACGDDTVDDRAADSLPAATATPGTSATPTSTVAAAGYDHPEGADQVVFSYAEVGGFTTREYAFQRTPSVMVAGDGRVFTPGPQLAIYPGPLVPAIQVQTITEDGVQRLLAAADAAGLFADIEYAGNDNIADATSARVTVTANGATWVHEAYALGIASGAPGEGSAESTPERQALADFVVRLGDLTSIVGADDLGPIEIFEPEHFVVEALVADQLGEFPSEGFEPRIVEWPAEASVALEDMVVDRLGTVTDEALGCTVVPAQEYGRLFADADQLTYFADGTFSYQVLVRPMLPGDVCSGS